MIPNSISKMIVDMKHDMTSISNNIVKWKYKFCVDFEKEMDIEPSNYSQSIFDYLFNLFFFKKAFSELDFKKYLNEFKELNFRDIFDVSDYIKKKYQEFIIKYKTFFMDHFGFKHDDPMYIERKIQDNKKQTVQKLLEYY